MLKVGEATSKLVPVGPMRQSIALYLF
jgi:hypothetical protein